MEERKKKGSYGEVRRKQAKQDLLTVLDQVGVSDGKERALAVFSLRSGHTMKRAAEYLDELVAAGLIEVEGNAVRSPRGKGLNEVKAP